MKNILLFAMFLALTLVSYAQVGIGTTNPNSSAMLDITSESKGLLIPRLTTAARLSLVPDSKGESVLVYDIELKRFYSYINSEWMILTTHQSNSNDDIIINSDVTINGRLNVNGTGTVPIGGIIMWSGTIIPEGWALCNGNWYNPDSTTLKSATEVAGYLKTPDLLGRFIVGYDTQTSSSYGIEKNYTNTGNYSSENASLTSNGYDDGNNGGVISTFLAKNNIPQHKHVLDDGVDGAVFDLSGEHYHTNADNDPSAIPSIQQIYANFEVNNVVNDIVYVPDTILDLISYHRHTGITGSGASDGLTNIMGVGSSAPHENRPPYYALAYIMRLR